MKDTQDVDGVLLLFHHFPGENAPTIMEHVESFARHSRFPVFAVNTDRGFPRALEHLRFRAVVLHYSLFGGDYYFLSRHYRRYLDDSRDGSYAVAFFQDEMRFCQKRFEFLDRFGIDAVYTLLEPEEHAKVYGTYTNVREMRTTLTGYVSDELIDLAKQLTLAADARPIDVGYRARQLPFWMGRGAQEKHEIAERFVERAQLLDLRLDIDSGESARIYGGSWFDFVASCRGMLGVEAGTSIFDLDDTARVKTEALLAHDPELTFEQVEEQLLSDYEDKVFYRTVSPRHFEAAALRVVQILYPGRYSGVLEADVHYLALEKDFSNFDDVMRRFADPAERRQITDRAYEDLVASGRWSYASFVHDFDGHLSATGVGATLLAGERRTIDRRLRRGARFGQIVAHSRWFLRNVQFPGRARVASSYRRLRASSDVRR